MGQVVRRIQPEELTAGAWAPFGWLPRPDTDPADGSDRLAFAWADAHVNLIGHRVDEVPAADGGLRCEELFRHLTHTQVLMPLDVPAVVVVAAPDVDPRTPDGSAQVRAFALPVQAAVVLHRGTWHWGPYPARGSSVTLFNVQGLRYGEDNDRADLRAAGHPVEVVLA